jgi:hypothetical protein
VKEGVLCLENKVITRKRNREKTMSLLYKYIYLEEDKTSGYVCSGGIMMQINPQKGVRLSEKDKFWFD